MLYKPRGHVVDGVVGTPQSIRTGLNETTQQHWLIKPG